MHIIRGVFRHYQVLVPVFLGSKFKLVTLFCHAHRQRALFIVVKQIIGHRAIILRLLICDRIRIKRLLRKIGTQGIAAVGSQVIHVQAGRLVHRKHRQLDALDRADSGLVFDTGGRLSAVDVDRVPAVGTVTGNRNRGEPAGGNSAHRLSLM